MKLRNEKRDGRLVEGRASATHPDLRYHTLFSRRSPADRLCPGLLLLILEGRIPMRLAAGDNRSDVKLVAIHLVGRRKTFNGGHSNSNSLLIGGALGQRCHEFGLVAFVTTRLDFQRVCPRRLSN